MAGPDDDALPRIEIAGILVFAHLDTADHRLVRHSHTVPLHVEVEDTTVQSTATPAESAARQGRQA
ncbi:hypothetical protein [Streptomyces sp. NPDC005017]|uniref:hypothetical protein n=1 Tax=Streptomyces sp. NPDC005017 TaxID=3364706 RepID=UPI0036C47AA5